jgi:hypothetical protein
MKLSFQFPWLLSKRRYTGRFWVSLWLNSNPWASDNVSSGQNVEILGSLTQSTSSRVNNAMKKSNLNNLLMQLRKYVLDFSPWPSISSSFYSRCLQHPYLVSPELEPTGTHLTKQATHVNLRDASAKLRLLHIMLPKLKAKGHRVLLFSQVSFDMGAQIVLFSVVCHCFRHHRRFPYRRKLQFSTSCK